MLHQTFGFTNPFLLTKCLIAEGFFSPRRKRAYNVARAGGETNPAIFVRCGFVNLSASITLVFQVKPPHYDDAELFLYGQGKCVNQGGGWMWPENLVGFKSKQNSMEHA